MKNRKILNKKPLLFLFGSFLYALVLIAIFSNKTTNIENSEFVANTDLVQAQANLEYREVSELEIEKAEVNEEHSDDGEVKGDTCNQKLSFWYL
jgi:CHASE3 domain sensor protein